MSTATHTLVQFDQGKPKTALGIGSEVARTFSRKGSAENYRTKLVERAVRINKHRPSDKPLPLPDIRIMSVTIPDDGELVDGLYPGLLAVPAVSWS